jgi:hypothetical protein
MKLTNEPLPLWHWPCRLHLGIRWIHHRTPLAWPGQPIRTNALGSADSRWILGDGKPIESFALPNDRGKAHALAGCAGRVVQHYHGAARPVQPAFACRLDQGVRHPWLQAPVEQFR